MSDQNWLAYTGAIAGIIGAITGVAGAFLALLAFRRTGQLKALDLRLELRRTESTLQSDIHDLVSLLQNAKASRTRRPSAVFTGMFCRLGSLLLSLPVTATACA